MVKHDSKRGNTARAIQQREPRSFDNHSKTLQKAAGNGTNVTFEVDGVALDQKISGLCARHRDD